MITYHSFSPKNADLIIVLMQQLCAFFSPETISFAEKNLSTLQGILAFDKEECIGFIVFKGLSSIHAKLYRMGILPSYQHQGIGSQLLQQIEEILLGMHIQTLELLTLDEHPDYPGYAFTKKFYHKHQFHTIESFEDEGVVILKMQKNLNFG